MSTKEIWVFIVSLLFFVGLCVLFTYLFARYFKSMGNDVLSGAEDATLLADEQQAAKRGKAHQRLRWAFRILGDALLGVLLLAFGFSLYARASGNEPMIGGKEVLMVASGSMSEKNAANAYLEENNLTNQFDTYDLIGISRYASPEEVALYDVVAYKSPSGVTVVHRVIEIAEEDGETVYLTRGDSNNASDNNGAIYEGYLHYSSIVGHYDGWRWRKIGVVISFLQNSEGWLTVAAIAYCAGAYSYFEARYQKNVKARLLTLASKANADSPKSDLGGKTA